MTEQFRPIESTLEGLLDSLSTADIDYASAVRRAEADTTTLRNDREFGVVGTRVGGSIGKGTDIAPLSDVDPYIYLDAARWRTRGQLLLPGTVIGRLHSRIETRLTFDGGNDHVALRKQTRSVGIRFKRAGSVGIDVGFLTKKARGRASLPWWRAGGRPRGCNGVVALVLLCAACAAPENGLDALVGDAGGAPDSSEPTAELAAVYLSTISALYTYDRASNAATLVGAYDNADWIADIALGPGGAMYASGLAGLYAVDPASGDNWRVGDMQSGFDGLASMPDGRLLASKGAEVWIVDPVALEERVLLATDGFFESGGDLVCLPGGEAYWTVVSGNARALLRIDIDAERAELVGWQGTDLVHGLAFVDGTLLGFTAQNAALVIDPATAAVLARYEIPGGWSGAASAPPVEIEDE